MSNRINRLITGHRNFRQMYASGDSSMMQKLSLTGQKPEFMVIACCDSRVDPSIIFQCHPGDLFVVRNIANIVPPYEKDHLHHGTSAALEVGICMMEIKHLILLGHSQCGGINILLKNLQPEQNDFIDSWVSVVNSDEATESISSDDYAKKALHHSFKNCLSFPWMKERFEQQKLFIHRWFFDISEGNVLCYSEETQSYQPLLDIYTQNT